MIFIVITICVLTISYFLFRKVAGTMSIRRINMISWIFYYFLVLQCIIGAVQVVLEIDHHYMIDNVQYPHTRVYGFFAICWVLIGLPLGMLLSCSLLRVPSMKILLNNYCNSKIIRGGYGVSEKWVYQISLLISIISMGSVLYVFAVIHEMPFLKFFSAESAVDLALYRQSANRFFPGNEYVKNLLALYVCPIFSYIAYCYYLNEKTKGNLLWWSCSLFCSLAIVNFDMSKAPVLVYSLGYLFLYVLRGFSISRKTLIWVSGSLIGVLIVMYIVIMQSPFEDLLHLNSGFIGRLTLSSVAGVFLSFDLWPMHYDYLGLSSISQFISSMFGLPYNENSARLIMAYINPSRFYGHSAGMVNSLFVGEAYAMFGWVGVIISPIYVGLLIQTLYIFFLKSPKNPFSLGFFVNYSTLSTMMGGFGGYLYNIQILVNLLLFMGIYGVGRFFRETRKLDNKNLKIKL